MLVVMHHNGKLMSAWLEFMNSSKPDLQSAALTALAKIFDQEDQHYVDNERRGQFGANLSTVFQFPGSDAITIDRIIELKQNLLRSLGQVKNVSPSHLLLRLAKQPIPSLRHAAKHLMRAVATQATGWGLQAMFNTTGHLHDAHVIQSEFWQYLKDRFTESSREGKEYKFAIIEAIARCPARALLHEDIGRELDVMVGQGPFYMPPRVKDMETL